MKHKFILKNKQTGYWKIANSKTGKSIKNFKSRWEAIDYLKSLKDISSYEIKYKNGWKIYNLINSESTIKNINEMEKANDSSKKVLGSDTSSNLSIKDSYENIASNKNKTISKKKGSYKNNKIKVLKTEKNADDLTIKTGKKSAADETKLSDQTSVKKSSSKKLIRNPRVFIFWLTVFLITAAIIVTLYFLNNQYNWV